MSDRDRRFSDLSDGPWDGHPRRDEIVVAVEEAFAAPEVDSEFESRLWARIEPKLESRRSPKVRVPSRLPAWFAMAAASAGLLIGAFVARQVSHQGPPVIAGESAVVGEALPEAARTRILEAAVLRHLERTERLLLEVEHGTGWVAAAATEDDVVDGSRLGHELLSDNRLYRIASRESGDARLAHFLDDLEPVLVEISHGPTGPSLVDLRDRLRDRDLLFKLRIVRHRLGDDVPRTTPANAPPSRAA